MKLDEKLLLLRKKYGYSQEQLADKLGIARQTIGKWENGQAVPEIGAFIKLSELYQITIDRLVKEDECNIAIFNSEDVKVKSFVDFLSKQNNMAMLHTEKKLSLVESVHMILPMSLGILNTMIVILVENYSREKK